MCTEQRTSPLFDKNIEFINFSMSQFYEEKRICQRHRASASKEDHVSHIRENDLSHILNYSCK